MCALYLRNDGELGAQIVQPDVGYVLTVNDNGACCRLYDTEQGQGQRRLARPRPPYDTDLKTNGRC